jgi:hypothetical protein
MKFLGHLLIGILILLLYPLIGSMAIIISLSSILIDLDHIQIMIKEKAYSIKKIKQLIKKTRDEYEKDHKNAFNGQIFILHSIEFAALLLIISYFYHIFLFIAIGCLIHIMIDAIHHSINRMPVYKWLFLTSNLFGE